MPSESKDTHFELNKYIEKYKEEWITNCNNSKKIKTKKGFPISFKFSIKKDQDTFSCTLEKKMDNPADFENSIYIIRLNFISDSNQTNKIQDKKLIAIRNKLSEEKKLKPDFNYPKVNKQNSEILYIGSSQKDLKARLCLHMGGKKGSNNKSTYALRLNKWFSGKVEIQIIAFDIPEQDKHLLQIIEDSCAFSLQPMYGKTGGNNK